MTTLTSIARQTTKTPMKTINVLLVLGAIAAAATLSACNTTEGAGKDIKAAGQGIENAAARNK